ncbi:MAG: hypothetical protein R3C68_16795 [Myxococcota bacterium]
MGPNDFFDWLEIDAGVRPFPYAVRRSPYRDRGVLLHRRLFILKSVDAVVFACDSTPGMVKTNRELLKQLLEALRAASGKGPEIEVLLQANKQDLPGALGADALRRSLEALSPAGTGCRLLSQYLSGCLMTIDKAIRLALAGAADSH